MGQKQSAFVVEIASPHPGGFQSIPQSDPDEIDEDNENDSSKWRIIVNPAANMHTSEQLRSLINQLQKTQRLISVSEARCLSTALHLLDSTSELLLPLLTVISNNTIYPANQRLFSKFGIPVQIVQLLNRVDREMPNATKIMLVQNIANMAVSLENSIALEPAIPLVVERADSSYSLESTVALQALINLSYNITSSQISVFLPVIPVCIKRLWVRGEVNIDSLRLLVNLSCCPDVVPHVLAAKTTVGLIRILDTDKIDALQRAVTWMLCLTSATEALVITSDMIENLIKDSKIDFPSTVYHSLYGTKGKKELENRAYEISLRTDEIGMKARQLSDSLTRIPKCYQSVSSLNRL